MSTLARFRKPMGLIQLIRLIETSEPDKRRQLLALVAKEDPGWAQMVQAKSLSFERILNWPDLILEKVLDQVPTGFIAAILQRSNFEQAEKIRRCLPARMMNEVQSKFDEKRASRQEQAVALHKMFQTIREMQDKGQLSFNQFDPSLDIDLRLVS